MSTTYFLRTLNADGSVRKTFRVSSIKALAAVIYEISTRRSLGESDELATRHESHVSVDFDVARVVDGEAIPGLTEAEMEELDAEVARRGPADEPPAWMSEA
jgi:hypothetical protein